MFKDMLSIKKNDVISIVGSGGKTTTMFLMGEELREKGSVLITTTTKIAIPKTLKSFESLYISIEDFLNSNINLKNKVVILGHSLENGKINGINEDEFNKVKDLFDYCLIEADGAKKYPLKAWREYEPVILKSTTKTLGIIPADCIDKKLDYSQVFNEELFKLNFKSKEYFTFDVLKRIIIHKEGIFKNSIGKKYIYFNRCEGEVKNSIGEIITHLKGETENINYFFGSNEEGYCES